MPLSCQIHPVRICVLLLHSDFDVPFPSCLLACIATAESRPGPHTRSLLETRKCQQAHVMPSTCCQMVCWWVSCQALTLLLCLQAVEAGRLDVAQKLIDFGVQLNVFDASLNTPLHLAVKLKVQDSLGCSSHLCACFSILRDAIFSQAPCKYVGLKMLHHFSLHKDFILLS